jgi:hypothetical protein
MQIDKDFFTAKMYHGLKSLLVPGDKLPARFLEYSVCDAFGMTPKGDGNYYADGVKYNVPTSTAPINVQASIKTVGLKPDILKKKEDSRDFRTHSEKFLGYQFNTKHQTATNGIQIIQRRQAVPVDDETSAPELVGELAIAGFGDNIKESSSKFGTDASYEIIVVHGYNRDMSRYMANVYWQPYNMPDHITMSWKREKSSVVGYHTVNIDGKDWTVKVCERVNGNSKRLSTNFIEYKNPTNYMYSAEFTMPIPEPWEFDKDKILKEMQEHIDSENKE